MQMQGTISSGQALIVIRLLLWTLGFRSPITNMMLQNQIDQAIVSVWLNKASEQDAKLSKGGQFIFGGVDPSLYTGSITYLPVTSDSQWQVAVDEVYIGRKELAISKSSSYAVVDTGSSYILFPDYLATAFHRAIPNSQYDKDLGWMIPCTLAKSTSVGDLTFVLGGQKFAVPLSDIVILESGFKGICLSAVDSWSEATNGPSGESVSISSQWTFGLICKDFPCYEMSNKSLFYIFDVDSKSCWETYLSRIIILYTTTRIGRLDLHKRCQWLQAESDSTLRTLHLLYRELGRSIGR